MPETELSSSNAARWLALLCAATQNPLGAREVLAFFRANVAENN
jgi:hypothetical protein